MKQTIRLNESELHRIIKESVNMLLNEIGQHSMVSIPDDNRANDAFQAVIGNKQHVNNMVQNYINEPEMWDDPDLSNDYQFAEELSQEYELSEDEAIEIVTKVKDYVKNLGQKQMSDRVNESITRAIRKYLH
jgi:hypothetical protein